MKYCVYKNHNLSGNFFIHSIPFVQKVKNVVDIVFYKLKVMLDFIFCGRCTVYVEVADGYEQQYCNKPSLYLILGFFYFLRDEINLDS